MTPFYTWVTGLAHSGVLPADFQYPFLVRGFLCVLLLTPMLGGLSHLVVARRMAFFSAALGQAALTGVSLGLLIGEPLNSPYAGMFGFCLLATLGMVYVKRRSSLPPDTLIGVFLALSLGLGLVLLVAVTRQFNVHQVEAILFGSLLTVTDSDLLLLLAVGVVVMVLLAREYNHLLLDSLSPPLAGVEGSDSRFLDYFFAFLLALSIVVSLKIIGALLVEALVVVPAAASRNVARSARGYLAWSVVVAFVAGAGGRRRRPRREPRVLRDARGGRAGTRLAGPRGAWTSGRRHGRGRRGRHSARESNADWRAARRRRRLLLQVRLAHVVTNDQRLRTNDYRLTMAIPQGPRPTGIFFVKLPVAMSRTETSLDGPFAV
jgi:zinc transport system permease protein